MERKEIANIELAKHCGVTEGTIRYWKKEKKSFYENAVKDYIASLEDSKEKETRVVVVTNFKGGAGKSTLSDMIGHQTKDCVVFNIDIGATASKINSTKTYDYAEVYSEDSTIGTKEVLNELKKDYNCIIVDTAGDATDELIDILEQGDDFIIPFNTGKRATEVTLNTVKTILQSGLLHKGKHKIVFVLNNFNGKIEEVEDEIISFEKEVDRIIKQHKPDNVEIEYTFTYLQSSNAIRTMERKQKSIEELYAENKLAYKVFKQRVNRLVSDIHEFLNLESK